MNVKTKLLVSFFLVVVLTNMVFVSVIGARTFNVLQTREYVYGSCESENYYYNFDISVITNYGKNAHSKIDTAHLSIQNKATGVWDGYESLELDLVWSMNHGKATFDVDGMPTTVEWTAEGKVEVTKEEFEIIYHEYSLMYVSEKEYCKTQGSCTLFYDGDVVEGSIGEAGHWMQEVRIVPIQE